MSNYINAQTVGIACGVGFLAYCVYFDHKRRIAPDYRDKVRARREKERLARESEDEIELPSVDDEAGLEKFFVKEIEIGERLMYEGELDRAIKHLAYAVALCPQPQQLLQYLKEVLPTNGHVKLIEQLKIANQRVSETYRQQQQQQQQQHIQSAAILPDSIDMVDTD